MIDTNDLIKSLGVYKDTHKGVYRGICKEHFPKWHGWGLIAGGFDKEVVDAEVLKFYKTFFYEALGLSELSNPCIAYAILNFATMHGKKKVIQKLQKTTESDAQGVELIHLFNSQGKCSEYKLLLEMLDFYIFTGAISEVSWVTGVYRCM